MTPSRLQTAVGTNVAGVPTVAWTGNLTPGSLLVATVGTYSTGHTFSCSDNANGPNTPWTEVLAAQQSTTGYSSTILVFPNNQSAGTPTVTFAMLPSGAPASVILQEFAPIPATLTVDGANATGWNSTAQTPTTNVPAVAVGDLIVAFCVNNNGSLTAGSGFTGALDDGAGNKAEYQVATSGGTVAAAFTGALNTVYSISAIAVNAAIASGFTPQRMLLGV